MNLHAHRNLLWQLLMWTAVLGLVRVQAIERTWLGTQFLEKSWDDPTIWSPNDGLAPHKGDSYRVLCCGMNSYPILRNPITGTDLVFGGDSLQLGGALRLYAKAPGQDTTVTFADGGLIMGGGNVNLRDDVVFTIAGMINVRDASDNYFNTRFNDYTNRGAFKIDAEIQGPGRFRMSSGLTSTPTFEITSNNSELSGGWHLAGGWLKASREGSLGSGGISLSEFYTPLGVVPAILDVDYDFVSEGDLEMQAHAMILLDQHLTFNWVHIRPVENGEWITLTPGSYSIEELRARFPDHFAEIGNGSTIDGRLTVLAPEPNVAAGLFCSGFLLLASRRKRIDPRRKS
jgi:hypothetical protein